jgi:hypothetical protein
MVAELDRRTRIELDQLPQCRAALKERWPFEVLAVEVQEIEGKEHEPMRRLVDSRAERVEVRNAVLVLDNGLTIDQGRFTGELAGSLDNPAIGSGPVPAMTREGPDSAAIDDDRGAIAWFLMS